MVLLEKLNKIESSIQEQGTTLGRLQETVSLVGPLLKNRPSLFDNTNISPSPPTESSNIAFQVPKGGWASLDHFMSLPFIQKLLPQGQKIDTFIHDSPEAPRENKSLPNLEKGHVQGLVDRCLTEILPLHPIIEVNTVDQFVKELDEDGLLWTGPTALILHILSVGSVLAGEDSLDYQFAAKRRMGFAVEKVDLVAIQTHYLQG